MKPPRFHYHDPVTLQEALDLLARHGEEARLLAGGQSLMPMLNFRLARPGHVIDINRVAGLDTVTRSERGLRLGALVRQRTLERSPLIREVFTCEPCVRGRACVMRSTFPSTRTRRRRIGA